MVHEIQEGLKNCLDKDPDLKSTNKPPVSS